MELIDNVLQKEYNIAVIMNNNEKSHIMVPKRTQAIRKITVYRYKKGANNERIYYHGKRPATIGILRLYNSKLDTMRSSIIIVMVIIPWIIEHIISVFILFNLSIINKVKQPYQILL